MIIRRLALLATATCALCCLSSCTLIGGLVQSIFRLPGTVLGTITDAEAKPDLTVDPQSAATEPSEPEPVSIVVAPIE